MTAATPRTMLAALALEADRVDGPPPDRADAAPPALGAMLGQLGRARRLGRLGQLGRRLGRSAPPAEMIRWVTLAHDAGRLSAA